MPLTFLRNFILNFTTSLTISFTFSGFTQITNKYCTSKGNSKRGQSKQSKSKRTAEVLLRNTCSWYERNLFTEPV